MLWLSTLAVSWALTGLIWTIQLVHYPSFRYVSAAEFAAFHRHHTWSIVPIVAALMLLELCLAVWMAFLNGWSLLFVIPLLAVLVIWASTFSLSIPLHRRLGRGKDATAIRLLVNTNWPRTVLWTAKAVWVTWLFAKRL